MIYKKMSLSFFATTILLFLFLVSCSVSDASRVRFKHYSDLNCKSKVTFDKIYETDKCLSDFGPNHLTGFVTCSKVNASSCIRASSFGNDRSCSDAKRERKMDAVANTCFDDVKIRPPPDFAWMKLYNVSSGRNNCSDSLKHFEALINKCSWMGIHGFGIVSGGDEGGTTYPCTVATMSLFGSANSTCSWKNAETWEVAASGGSCNSGMQVECLDN